MPLSYSLLSASSASSASSSFPPAHFTAANQRQPDSGDIGLIILGLLGLGFVAKWVYQWDHRRQ